MTVINPPSEDIKDMLESTDEVDLTFGTNLFIAVMPNSPDNAVLINDYTGMGQDRHGLEIPNLQIICRNNVYNTGYEMIKNIKYFLHEKVNETINGARYISIMNISDIGFLGHDSKNRFQWSTNFQIYRTAT